MKAATLFSGIGAPEQAMPHWQWCWCAEIEAFPSAVLAKRHPHTVNLGDVNAPDFVERAAAIGRPDVIVFGSPCQDFSVAGRRLGLDGARGNLALIALGIIDRLKPRWFAFENVPGLLSNWSGGPECPAGAGSTIDGNENSDFAAFLGLVDELGYSGAWASLDAQWFGLAQRRERLFFVGYLGDWRGPAAVLLEPESLCGDHPPSRTAGERITGTVEARTDAGGAGWGTDFMCGGGLAAEESAFALEADKSPTGNLRGDGSDNLVVAKSVPARPWAAHREDSDTLVVAGAVSSKWSKGTGGPSGDECYNLVADPISANEGRTYTHEGTNNFRLHNVVPVHSDASRSNSAALTPSPDAEGRIRLRDPGIGIGDQDDPMFTLAATGTHAVAFDAVAAPEPGFINPRQIRNSNTSNQIGIKPDAKVSDALSSDGGGAVMVTAFDTTQITHPENRCNPQPGDACHPLAAEAHPPAIAFSCKDHGGDASELAPTLRAMGHSESHANAGGQVAVAFQTRIARNGRGQPEEICPALNGADAGATSDMRPVVALSFKPSHYTRGKDGAPSEVLSPLTKETDKGDQDPVLLAGAAVRRLTPTECARLQGFPDNYLDITYRGKAAADGNKYKALGNAMAVPVLHWILQRIDIVDALLSYDGARGHADFAASFNACLEAVRERVANGGPGWEPK
jgi:DNA (cytosine-5)-methyltransferase 1